MKTPMKTLITALISTVTASIQDLKNGWDTLNKTRADFDAATQEQERLLKSDTLEDASELGRKLSEVQVSLPILERRLKDLPNAVTGAWDKLATATVTLAAELEDSAAEKLRKALEDLLDSAAVQLHAIGLQCLASHIATNARAALALILEESPPTAQLFHQLNEAAHKLTEITSRMEAGLPIINPPLNDLMAACTRLKIMHETPLDISGPELQCIFHHASIAPLIALHRQARQERLTAYAGIIGNEPTPSQLAIDTAVERASSVITLASNSDTASDPKSATAKVQ
jgi:hypothetical protein